MLVNPLCIRLVVTNRLVGNVNDYVVFFALQSASDINPVVSRTRDSAGCAFFTTASSVVNFKHTNDLCGFTQRNDVGHVRRAVASPLLAVAQYNTNNVRTGRCNVSDRLSFTGVPSVCMVNTAHYESVTVSV